MSENLINLQDELVQIRNRMAELQELYLHPPAGTPLEKDQYRDEIMELIEQCRSAQESLLGVKDNLHAARVLVSGLNPAEIDEFVVALGKLHRVIQREQTLEQIRLTVEAGLSAAATIRARGSAAPAPAPAPVLPAATRSIRGPFRRVGGVASAKARDPVAAPAGSPVILCVHGVGHQENDPQFESSWRQVITRRLQVWNPTLRPTVRFVFYDQLFADREVTAMDVTEALFRLGLSGMARGMADWFRSTRGFAKINDTIRWTAGMIGQWAADEELRRELREAVARQVEVHQPQVILAHSLGSLISYDLFRQPAGAALLKDRYYGTLGCQIGNAFVRDTLGGRIVPLPQCRKWFHLYNPNDKVFAAPLKFQADNFEQVWSEFDIDGFADHDAVAYLDNTATSQSLWRTLATEAGAAIGSGGKGVRLVGSQRLFEQHVQTIQIVRRRQKPSHRALLVGINEYPDPENRLEGCVNDVFQMSATLQECGFEPENIRVVLDDRATSKAVLDRLEWLVEGAQDGQHRVFYYSGHGAQIPTYGVGETVDGVDECLVTYDFDWSRDHAVVDDQFYEFYSQLPDEANFLAILDCCHSGGMTREGGVRVRGLSPPDDIRHRALRWDVAEQVWTPRELGGHAKGKSVLANRQVAQRKLGQRTRQRAQVLKGFAAYDPVLLYACAEDQLAQEYRHGATSYGAFTYCVTQQFRSTLAALRKGRIEQLPTWTELCRDVGLKLQRLKYHQTPQLHAPRGMAGKPIPWMNREPTRAPVRTKR